MAKHLEKTGILYCRVSSEEQVEGTSLDTQERACREYAGREGITVLETFIERGESAKTADRKELNRAVAFCKQRRVGFFIVYKLDRFARNQDDHVMVRTYLRRCGTELRSVTEPIDETPIGRAMEGVLSVFAEFDNNVRTERSKQGMLERVRQGMWVWPAPLGYRRTEKGGNLVPDPERAPFIRLAFELYATGAYTYERLASHLAAQGLRTRHGGKPTATSIFKILSRPVYCGTIRTGGEEYAGSFEPLISRELFALCQPEHFRPASALAAPRSLNNPLFPLRGVVQCTSCGKTLTGSQSTGSKGTRYAYYHHYRPSCPIARAVPKAELEKQFFSFLSTLRIDQRVRASLHCALSECAAQFSTRQAQFRAHVQKELTELESARQKIFQLHRAGVYTNDEFLEQRSIVDDRIKQKHLSLVNRVEEVDWDLKAETCLNLLSDPLATWQGFSSDFAKQLRFQKLLVPKGLTYDGQTLRTPKLSLIYELLEGSRDAKFRLEPLLEERWNEVVDELEAWNALHLA
jgi:DNA invertase Pin-like site-specific DNA recombinase